MACDAKIKEGLHQIKVLCKSLRAAVLDNQMGAFFHMTVGVCQGCPLLLTLFDVLFKNIMYETLHDHCASIQQVEGQ